MKNNTYNAHLYGIGFVATMFADMLWKDRNIHRLAEDIFGILQQMFFEQVIDCRAINGEKALWLSFTNKKSVRKLLIYFDNKEKTWSNNINNPIHLS